MSLVQTLSPIEILVRETRNALIIAKADGELNAGEIIQIAADLATKVQKLTGLSGVDKKATLILILKKGLDSSGGLDSLPGFAGTTAEVKQAFEDSLLMAASAAVDMLFSVASGKLDLRKPSSWHTCLPACFKALQVLLPKDQALLEQATAYKNKILKTPSSPSNSEAVSLEEVKIPSEETVTTEITTVAKAVVANKATNVTTTATKTTPAKTSSAPVLKATDIPGAPSV